MKRPLPEDSRSLRQKEFITAAARLFSARGYDAVGINDISAELGLTGPAIYRHYPSKEALLVAVFDDVISSHLEQLRDLVSSIDDPREALDAIVQHHMDFVFEQTDNLVIWRTEYRSIPEADRHRLRYLQRLYTEEWVRTIKKLRPELGDDQIRTMCHAAIGLLQSPTEFQSPLTQEQIVPLLASMAIQSLVGSAVVPLADPAPRAPRRETAKGSSREAKASSRKAKVS